MKINKLTIGLAAAAALTCVGAYFLVFNFFVLAGPGALPQASGKNNETAAPAKEEISFAFAGDVMLGRNVGDRFQKNNFKDLFVNFDAGAFSGKDIVWLNLEGPISDKQVKQNPADHSLVFNFSREAIEALKYLKITTAGLANNHTDNQGQAGLSKTKEILKQAKIEANGEPNTISEAGIVRYRQGELTVALIAVNALYGRTDGMGELIKREKGKNNFVIVLPHWGSEYQTAHGAGQEKMAKNWIAAGADLIIGMHPHVVQDAQLINGKLVFYSLGNFIFDQMFSAETQQGLILSGTISADELKIKLVPIVSKKMKPEIMAGPERQKIMDRICRPLGEYCDGDEIGL
ncbi:MAG: CapA family protein [bacterium]|nr:CapA family protein [bacterium]